MKPPSRPPPGMLGPICSSGLVGAGLDSLGSSALVCQHCLECRRSPKSTPFSLIQRTDPIESADFQGIPVDPTYPIAGNLQSHLGTAGLLDQLDSLDEQATSDREERLSIQRWNVRHPAVQKLVEVAQSFLWRGGSVKDNTIALYSCHTQIS